MYYLGMIHNGRLYKWFDFPVSFCDLTYWAKLMLEYATRGNENIRFIYQDITVTDVPDVARSYFELGV